MDDSNSIRIAPGRNLSEEKNNLSFFINAIILAFSVLFLTLITCSCDITEYEKSTSSSAWVVTWGTAQQLVEPHNMPPEPGLNKNTLRQIVRVSIGGDRLRVRISNEYSTRPVMIKSAHLAVSQGGSAINPDTDVALNFAGENTATIEPGATLTSDPFYFQLKPRSDIAITIHFCETSPDVTGHPGSRTTSFLQQGEMVADVNMQGAAETDHWYMIDSIEVMHEKPAMAVAVIGDSISDGRGSGTNKQNRWPDELAGRLQESQETDNVAVLNMGIGGNCVLRDCLGPAGLARFEKDVLEQNGVRWVIILEGINDIGQAQGEEAGVTAKNLITAYEHMIDLAHNRGILVYGATLLPFGDSFYDNMWRESARQTVNNWIRTGKRFDAVIDLEKALEDPENPAHMLPVADTGDHLHPNETGHRMMAEAVDLKLFRFGRAD